MNGYEFALAVVIVIASLIALLYIASAVRDVALGRDPRLDREAATAAARQVRRDS